MTEKDAPLETAFVDIVMKRCSLSREPQIPPDATYSFNVQLTLLNAPSNTLSVALEVTVTPGAPESSGGEPTPPALVATAEYIVIAERTFAKLTDEVGPALLRFAWPYLRVTLDVLTGMARLPSFGMTAVAPNVHIEVQEE